MSPIFEESYAHSVGYFFDEMDELPVVRRARESLANNTYQPPTAYFQHPEIPPRRFDPIPISQVLPFDFQFDLLLHHITIPDEPLPHLLRIPSNPFRDYLCGRTEHSVSTDRTVLSGPSTRTTSSGHAPRPKLATSSHKQRVQPSIACPQIRTIKIPVEDVVIPPHPPEEMSIAWHPPYDPIKEAIASGEFVLNPRGVYDHLPSPSVEDSEDSEREKEASQSRKKDKEKVSEVRGEGVREKSKGKVGVINDSLKSTVSYSKRTGSQNSSAASTASGSMSSEHNTTHAIALAPTPSATSLSVIPKLPRPLHASSVAITRPRPRPRPISISSGSSSASSRYANGYYMDETLKQYLHLVHGCGADRVAEMAELARTDNPKLLFELEAIGVTAAEKLWFTHHLFDTFPAVDWYPRK